MADQYNLNINQLKMHAPQSPMLAFRPVDTGSPQQDWCAHLQNFPRYRRELEEFSVLGDVIVRIAAGSEPAPLERVKILSLEYAVKTLGDETDGREFVRSVKAIASPDASSFELEQIAAFYYGEIRRRGTSEVLTEMGLLGMQLEAVTATVESREIDFYETEIAEQKLTVADQRRVKKAQETSAPLPPKTPNFDDEMSFIFHRLGNSKITKIRTDEFAEYYLSDGNKSIEELDADFTTFDRLEQYDENGVLGFSMEGGQHSIVVYELNGEVDSSYLPEHARSALAKEMSLIFVGHSIGGAAAQKARHFTVANSILQRELKEMQKGASQLFSTPMPAVDTFSNLPFSNEEFSEWLSAKLDELYPHRTLRSVRRLLTDKSGRLFEYQRALEVNSDFAEMQYVAGVCQILWSQMQADFHLRSLRRESYQNLHLSIRKCVDTAEVARLKKQAFEDFKEHKKLNLKEFTALNTAAKSQQVRLNGKTSPAARKTLLEINAASANRLRYLKYFLYNDRAVQTLTRQEKQQLWEAVRRRETTLKATVNQVVSQPKQTVQPPFLQRQPNANKQVVRLFPRSV